MSARKIIVPGEVLGEHVEGKYPYILEDEGVKRATVIGALDEKEDKATFSPLEGVYIPKPGDVVIGIISGVGVTNWFVDINSPYTAILNVQDFLGRPYNPATDDLSRILAIGDYIKAKIAAFDRSRSPLLTVQEEGLGRIVEGKVIEVKPTRIPRIIGRKRSMINMLAEETGCEIFAAVNGRVHLKCPNEDLEAILVMAIRTIEREPHRYGLTEHIRKLIQQEKLVRGVEVG